MKIRLASDIGLASRVVTMRDVLVAIGFPDVEYALSGAKVNCPFGAVFHPDGQRAFRVYDNESAYCYACAEKFFPVQLYAKYKDVSLDDAAEQLLELVHYKPLDADERFLQASTPAGSVDETSLIGALKTYCARTFPDWEFMQTEDEIASVFVKCTSLLPLVRTSEDGKEWLRVSKKAMTKAIGEPHE